MGMVMMVKAAVRFFLGLDWEFHARLWAQREPTHAWHKWGRTLAALGVSAFGLGIAFKIAAMLVPFGVCMLGLALSRAPIHRMPGVWPLMCLFVWCVVSSLMSSNSNPVNSWGYVYCGFAAPIACCAIVARPWAARWLTIGLFVGVLMHAGLGAIQFVIGVNPDAPLQIDPNGLRFQLAPGWKKHNVGPAVYAGSILLLAWHARSANRAPSMLKWAARFAAMSAVLMTRARTAILALMVGLVGTCVQSGRRLLLGLVLSFLCGSVGIGFFYYRSPDRVTAMFQFNDPRIAYWRLGVSDVIEHPWFGQGGQQAFAHNVEQRWAVVNPERPFEIVVKYNLHNTPLNFAAFHGVPASILHLTFLLSFALVCWHAARRYDGVSFGLWCYMFMCGMFDATWTAQTSAYPFAAVLALSLWPIGRANDLIADETDGVVESVGDAGSEGPVIAK